MRKNKKTQLFAKSIFALLASVVFVSSISIGNANKNDNKNDQNEITTVDKILGNIDYSIDEKSLNKDLVLDARDAEVSANTELSLIIELEGTALIDTYKSAGFDNVTEYSKSTEGKAKANINLKKQKNLIKSLNKKNLINEVTSNYSVLLNAIVVKTEYKNLEKIEKLSGVKNVIVSSNYEKPKTLSGSAGAIYNDANVYDTGIYDSSDVEYTGEGTVVSVLDTGCDYTHSAFQTAPLNPRLSKDDVNAVLEHSMAYSLDKTIDIDDVYYSEKIPFGFDYADKDPNIYPLIEDHGTHVAGIIGGQDEVITGVAVNTQLVIMKVFPDSDTGAPTDGILQALEDSVLLGVDVINMSLGSTIGFTREEDNKYINEVYEKIEDAGIALDVAAGNEYSGGYGGEQSNTNFATNPDSGVVGSPSTYKPSMAVASINGILEPYVVAKNADGETTAFLTQGAHMNGDDYDFVQMLGLSENGIREKEYEYVTVPGYGLQVNYAAIDVEGKIALVKRGNNTFAEKIAYAEAAGAAGILIYNNVTGVIKMSVGEKVQIGVASISRAAGEAMAKHPKGTIKVSVDQKAGPFMSDFSSWGPTPSLELKPEITAHGGNIKSAVIGGGYDVLSGTSMATPNLAGVSALMTEHLNKTNPDLVGEERLALINQIQMSTAAIVLNEEGNPYSPRKQGAGLANLYSSINTKSYLSVDGINKTKIELGHDPEKLGIYEFDFNLVNMSGDSLSYTVVPYTFTESMSSDEETIAELAYMLDPKMEVTVDENGTYESSSKKVTVNPNASVKISVKLTLSDADRKYIDTTFENGMYVEGFIELQSLENNPNEKDNIDLSIPFLGFYGDWAQAPIFDRDIFEVQSTEFDTSINEDDKIKSDYYTTTYYGKYYEYYIIPLGSYIYDVDSSKYDMIPATTEKAAISYNSSGINGLSSAQIGMLRSSKYIEIKIMDVSTGKVIYSKVQNNQRKAFYGSSGNITPSYVDFDDLNLMELGLANNSQYRLTIDAYLDGFDTTNNKKNSIAFDFFIDTEAPSVVDSRFYKEWDKSEKIYRSYVEIDVYDNRFAQAVRIGTVENGAFNSLTEYPIPIYQENANETTTVKIEITDFLPKIYATDIKDHLIIAIDDYALNNNLFLLPIGETMNPKLKFDNGEATVDVTLSPNQVFDVNTLMSNEGTFIEGLTWDSSNTTVAMANEGKIIALKEGNAVVTGKNMYQINYEAPSYEGGGKNYDLAKALKLTINVKVLGEGDVGYVEYQKPRLEKIGIKSYTTLSAFTDDYENTDLMENGYFSYFDTVKFLEVYPSESFKLDYSVTPWTVSEDRYEMKWISSNPRVAVVDSEGVVTAVGEGSCNITLSIIIDGREYTQKDTLRLVVKTPFVTTGTVLMAYKGATPLMEIKTVVENGYENTVYTMVPADQVPEEAKVDVVVPDDLGLKFIYPYAFSLYTYGEITDEYVIYNYVGNNTIRKIVIPEGVEQVMEGAFSGLTALEEVVLPSTLRTLEKQAFKDCPNLKTVNLNYVEKIGDNAFANCPKLVLNNTTDLQNTATIGINAFKGCTSLTTLNLSNIGYAGRNAFEGTTNLEDVRFSQLTYLSNGMFKDSGITNATLYAEVIPNGIFEGCSSLEEVTIVSDNVIISRDAFAGATNLNTVNLNQNANVVFENKAFANTTNLKNLVLPNGSISFNGNVFYNSGLEKMTLGANTIIENINNAPFENTNAFTTIEVSSDSNNYISNTNVLVDKNGKLLLVPTNYSENIELSNITSISSSAFAGNKTIKSMDISNSSEFVSIDEYAFYNSNIETVILPNHSIEIKDYAFAECKALTSVSNLDKVSIIGNYAFNNSSISNATLADDVVVGDYAFANTNNITIANIPNNAKLGDYAFANSSLNEINLTGSNITLGDYVFANNDKIVTIDLTNVVSIGNGVFKGAGRLANVELGTLEVITDELFKDCITLKEIDLSGVTSIGDSAFEGALLLNKVTNTTNLVSIGDNAFVNAQKLVTIDLSNVEEIGDFAFANSYSLKEVNLSNVETFGIEVFNSCAALTKVTLSENATELAEGLFFNCISLKTINSENLTKINRTAFANCTSLTNINLDSAVIIEEYAFYAAGLARATLPSAKTIEEYAFYGSKIRLLSMPVVEHINDFAFATTSLYKDVTLPASLVELGDYVFADNKSIERFVYEANGTKVDTGKVNDYIMLDQGVLYNKISDGYQLIAYPEAKKDTSYVIVEGTTKIATYAVAFQHYLVKVELPYTLKYIGDYAFLSDVDENGKPLSPLKVFVFNSYKAPILEGIYDDPDSYQFAIDYYDQYGNVTTDTSLAVEARISKRMEKMYEYAMFYEPYFYANFIGYVGQVENLSIEYPKNGIGYDGIIYNWFFDTKTQVAAVMSDITLNAFNAIEALKDAENITLDDEADVTQARVLYSYIDANDAEQLALVTNYDKLVAAEAKIKELKPLVMEELTKQVYNLIEGLKDPAEITLDDIYDVEEVRAFYNLIKDPDQLTFLTNIDKLLAAEAKIAELQAIATLPSHVLDVYNAINALPTEITLADETAIVAARTAYDALTDEEKALITEQGNKLSAAETALAALKNVAQPKDNNTGLIIGIVAGVIVVAGAVILVFLKKKKNAKN